MALFITSLIAGFLTILAPCVLPLLPVTLGGAVADAKNKKRPLIIIASLCVSVFAFTLLLKGSTALLNVSPSTWSYISAVILGIYGLSLVFPYAWAKIMLKMPGHRMGEATVSDSHSSAIVVGLALGPVFTTCSPTFFLILATVLPQSLGAGIVDLIAYIVGLAVALLLVSWIGQKLIDKLEWTINPTGWFRRALGILFVLIAVAIAFGFDKQIESSILASGFFDVTTLEQSIKGYFENMPTSSPQPSNPQANLTVGGLTALGAPAGTNTNAAPAQTVSIDEKIPGETDGGRYIDIVNPAGFVNSGPFKLADLVGKKVIIVDFIDYSCINCQRTFPYMKDWYAKYKDQGLAVVAFHTPEFAFEKDAKNVAMAAKMFGLIFPIVLDNDYATWNAYKNEYWPHKYIIDIHGRVVYDHIGEGEYDNTEKEIVKQLNIRKMVLKEPGTVALGGSTVKPMMIQTASPETYFGSARNEYFGNGVPGVSGADSFAVPKMLDMNQFYLGGKWSISGEYIDSQEAGAQISYSFLASRMYMVAETSMGEPVQAQVLLDGKPIANDVAGDDVRDGILTVSASRLYNLFKADMPGSHRIDIIWKTTGARLYTFTFG